ncbi:MAG: hypothetical protein ACKD6M_07760 [Candidatus Bathyarchaeota archaeon]
MILKSILGRSAWWIGGIEFTLTIHALTKFFAIRKNHSLISILILLLKLFLNPQEVISG